MAARKRGQGSCGVLVLVFALLAPAVETKAQALLEPAGGPGRENRMDRGRERTLDDTRWSEQTERINRLRFEGEGGCRREGRSS